MCDPYRGRHGCSRVGPRARGMWSENPLHVYHVSGPYLCCQWLPVAESDKTFPELKGAFVTLGHLEALRNTNICVPSAADRTLHPQGVQAALPVPAFGCRQGGGGVVRGCF